jgi:hypothetical protein
MDLPGRFSDAWLALFPHSSEWPTADEVAMNLPDYNFVPEVF